ncbi:hypothetical protein [Nitratidesulfovibrio vulgaris]|uniref:hypothetical protein n=1 Tax=Nitratidesulfovibrio vulgaris TaxID=881 RepID=UPI002301DE3E|nr:hypothetical protein [Nitratidesulfovibrio vulgaris]WCB46903.1 hypothetical protein PH214_02120 [Nitratidesulfovibrio vulgaris]
MSFPMPIVSSVISICINVKTVQTGKGACQDSEYDTTLQFHANAMHYSTPIDDNHCHKEKESDYHDNIKADIASVALHSQYTSSVATRNDFRHYHHTATSHLGASEA